MEDPLQTLQELEEETQQRRTRLRKRVTELAKQMVRRPMPKAIASLLRDATVNAVDMAVEEVLSSKPSTHIRATQSTTDALSQWSAAKQRTTSATTKSTSVSTSSSTSLASSQRRTSTKDTILSELTLDLVNDAFQPMEESLQEMEVSLERARSALAAAKSQASQAMEAIQAAAIAQAEGAAAVVQTAEEEAERKIIAEIYESADTVDYDMATLPLSELRLEDVDFGASEMAPPFLDEASCLIPGEPVVRVEKAPENSRRIFAGIDVMASVDDVWKVRSVYVYF